MLQLRPLQTAYALAAGKTIEHRVKEHGALPDDISDVYKAWQAAHEALSSLDLSGLVDARRIDPFLDRAILIPVKLAQLIVDAYTDAPVLLSAEQQQRLADARAVVEVFDRDLRKLVSIPFVEEWAAVQQILSRLHGDERVAGALKRLALGGDVALAQTLHTSYGQALGIGTAPEAPAENQKLGTWNEVFLDLLVAARHLNRKHPGLLDLFAIPYQEQLANQQSASKPTRKPPAPAPADPTPAS